MSDSIGKRISVRLSPGEWDCLRQLIAAAPYNSGTVSGQIAQAIRWFHQARIGTTQKPVEPAANSKPKKKAPKKVRGK